MAEVRLEHIDKVFANDIHAVRDLTLQVAEGELLVLVGPSGCGKTTLLRLIAGLEQPSGGSIRIGGREVNRLAPRQRDVALVFQRPAVYPHLTVRQNLAFGQALRQHTSTWQRTLLRWLRPTAFAHLRRRDQVLKDRVADAARTLGLDNLLDRLPHELSGGQQQRVALGRALVRRPAVFLLDEPLNNLDARLRLELRRELHLLQRREQATMVYVTHDPVEAMTLGDRVAVMDQGTLQQVGRTLEVFEQPSNRFVAGFFGWPPMSFVDGQLLRQDGRFSFVTGHWQLPLSAALATALAKQAGRPVVLGIRAEDVHLGFDPRPGVSGPVLQVELVEPQRNGALVSLTAPGWRVLGWYSGRERIAPGQNVMVDLQLERAFWFDPHSGRTLRGPLPAT
jgi:multiple sugar transport system ATP-binding protein